MRVAIDRAGRLILPKVFRDELDLDGAAELEITARDGVIELAVPDVHARIEEGPRGPRIVTTGLVRPMTAEDVRAALERVRR